MLAKDQRRFDRQYQKHLDMLRFRKMSESAIDVYSRAVRRVVKAFDCRPISSTRISTAPISPR